MNTDVVPQSRRVLVACFAAWTGFLFALHLFGATGRAIMETTDLIRYGHIVSARDYFAGLLRVFPFKIIEQLDLKLIVRMAAFLVVACALFLNPRPKLSRGGALVVLWILTLGQVFFMEVPLEGLACMMRSGDLRHGIDGELFGEDWFSWTASDLLLLSSLPFAVYLSGVRYGSKQQQEPK
ncbi:hypothetical protein IT570_12330 [Candidatus Sumerlaeota bacterium]|nr:hypothetical protein [Candidatus Sumerlaeota bacterium]